MSALARYLRQHERDARPVLAALVEQAEALLDAAGRVASPERAEATRDALAVAIAETEAELKAARRHLGRLTAALEPKP